MLSRPALGGNSPGEGPAVRADCAPRVKNEQECAVEPLFRGNDVGREGIADAITSSLLGGPGADGNSVAHDAEQQNARANEREVCCSVRSHVARRAWSLTSAISNRPTSDR